MKNRLHRRLLAASLLLPILSGCAAWRPIKPPPRELPPEPAFLQEVRVQHRVGDDLLLVAARERAGRAKANDIIFCARAERRALAAVLRQQPAPPPPDRCTLSR